MTTRRHALQTLGAAGLWGLLPQLAGAAATDEPVRLILQGTKGGPSVRSVKQLPSSNALLIGDDIYLVDAGYGATYRLIEEKLKLKNLRGIFITHNHSDHNIELGPTVYNAWTNALNHAIDVFGPEGTDALMKAYLESERFDLETRIEDEGRPDLRKLVHTHVYHAGVVTENEHFKVSALRNHHPPITESYALKFELKNGKTIVFSGDTSYFPPLAEFARNVDYLVHEAMYLPALKKLVQRAPNAQTLMKHLLAAHTSTGDVGRIAAAANVKNVVLTHFVPGAFPSVTDEDWRRGVREHYSGNVIVGHDMLEISIS